MTMVQLVYASTSSESCSPKEWMNILRSARKNNEAENITGVLVCDNSFFLQVLEGDRSKVNKLFRTILKDERHGEVTLISYKEIDFRGYSEWSMGYVHMDNTRKNLLRKYFPEATFLPYSLSANAAVRFLEEIASINQESMGQTPKQTT